LDLAIALSLAESTKALSSTVSSELSCTSSRVPTETPLQLAPPVHENKDEDEEDMKRALALSLMEMKRALALSLMDAPRRSIGWSCPTCTFLNIDSSHLYEMCARPPPAGPCSSSSVCSSSVAEIVTIWDDEQTVDDQPLSVIMTLSKETAETFRLCRADAELDVSMSFDDKALFLRGLSRNGHVWCAHLVTLVETRTATCARAPTQDCLWRWKLASVRSRPGRQYAVFLVATCPSAITASVRPRTRNVPLRNALLPGKGTMVCSMCWWGTTALSTRICCAKTTLSLTPSNLCS
jgi:hypothetical protein